MHRESSKPLIPATPSDRYVYAWDDSGDFWVRYDTTTGLAQALNSGGNWAGTPKPADASTKSINRCVAGDWSVGPTGSVNSGQIVNLRQVNGQIVALSNNSYRPIISPDGVSFGEPTLTFQGGGSQTSILDVCWTGTKYVAVVADAGGVSAYKSATLVDWTFIQSFGGTASATCKTNVCIGSDGAGKVAVFANSKVWTSIDDLSTNFVDKGAVNPTGGGNTTQADCIAYCNEYLVVFGSNGVSISDDNFATYSGIAAVSGGVRMKRVERLSNGTFAGIGSANATSLFSVGGSGDGLNWSFSNTATSSSASNGSIAFDGDFLYVRDGSTIYKTNGGPLLAAGQLPASGTHQLLGAINGAWSTLNTGATIYKLT